MAERKPPLLTTRCKHGAAPAESCLQRWTRGCPEGDQAAAKAKEEAKHG